MKNNIIKLLGVLSICILFINTANAQYQNNNHLIQQNKVGINAAYAGELDKTSVSLVGGVTQAKLEDSNDMSWQQITLDIPLANKLSTATVFTNVKFGGFSQLQIKQDFSYKVNLSENQTLSAGFGCAFNRQAINYGEGFVPNQFVDEQDSYLDGDKFSKNEFGIELGFVYQFKNFQFSLAFPSLFLEEPNNKSLSAYTQYKLEVDETWSLTPAVLLLQNITDDYEVTSSINVNYKDIGWFKFGLVDASQSVFGFGLNMSGLGLGYTYALPIDSKYSAMVNATHQFGLFFNFK